VSAERYVLLGLAPPRSPWFEALTQWTASAAVAAEFVKCVSAEEARVRLASGRRHSALLVDASSPSFDRDLVDAALEAATPVLVVRDARAPRFSARDLRISAELSAGFSRDELVEVLATHCRMIGRGDELPAAVTDPPAALWLGQLFAVCGAGGTGASTVAVALAQGLAADAHYAGAVLLADLARRADQAMLHEAIDLGPGLQELVEAHRVRRPDIDEIRRTTFDVPGRGYRLLLGLRQPEAWSALRPRAVDATIEGMRRSFRAVVADITGDFEGESEGGSADVEERNHLGRATALQATVVLAVGAPGMKGMHSLGWLVRSLVGIGVTPGRIVAVVSRSPRSPRARAESARALAAVLDGSRLELGLSGPAHVGERKLEVAWRDGAPLPGAVVDPLMRAVRAVAGRWADAAPPSAQPTRITPGSLGRWAEGTGTEPG
jgi:hypothetical protein